MSIPADRSATANAEPVDTEANTRHAHVAIVGAGFSGLGLAIRLKQSGLTNFVVLERAAQLAGTWRDNTYPGCACDVPSHLYSFSFALNPNWSRRFSPQREIWDYLRRCARRFGVEPSIQYNTEVQDARWDEDAQRWRITTSQGSLTADILALGNGPLSEPSLPNIPGIERFEGAVFHSARWDHEHNLSGERVAVIGTGASAIQFVPHIQPIVGQLTLFQRTPPWVMPRDDRAIPEWQRNLFQRAPITQRLVRDAIYWQREFSVLALVYRPELARGVQRQSLRHLARQVGDPDLRARLTPHYMMGCKRILLSDDFYPAVSQPNVEVVTDSIREIRPHSVVTQDGVEREVDTIILATGFHVTDMPAADYVHGREGCSLADVWRSDPQAYLGATVAGFPNLFLLIGPNTGLGHTSMIFMIEAQIAYILDCLYTMQKRHARTVEVRSEAQKTFNERLQQRMRGTVWTSGCKSWYLDASGRNSAIWPGFTWEYWLRTRRFDPSNYILTQPKAVAAGRSAAT